MLATSGAPRVMWSQKRGTFGVAMVVRVGCVLSVRGCQHNGVTLCAVGTVCDMVEGVAAY